MNYNKSKIIIKQKCRVSLYLCSFLALCLVSISGCSKNQQVPGSAISTETNQVTETMQAAEDVLIKMYFDIEKADYDKGYIRTRPLAGAQFFEFWRSENVGIDNQLLSNMHSVRRIVELSITDSDGDINNDCKVYVQRLSIPQREITSNSQAYQLFTRSRLSFQRLELHPEQEQGMAWLDLDRDVKLEEEILKRISSKLGKKYKSAKDETETAGDEL